MVEESWPGVSMVLWLRAGLVCQWFVVEESWPGVSMVLWLRAGLVCQWFCG